MAKSFKQALIVASFLLAQSLAFPPHHPSDWTAHNDWHCEPADISLPLTPIPIYFFPGTEHQVEALFQRSNAQILATSATPPQMWQFDPTNSTPPVKVHEFPGGNRSDLLGITELEHDVFYTATLNFTADDEEVKGSNRVWRVDMNTFEADDEGKVVKSATVSQLSIVKGAGVLNGFASMYSTNRPPPDFILVGDSLLGVVWKIKTDGTYTVAANDTSMKPVLPKNGGSEFLGINGIKVQEDYIYYTNSATSKMYRIPVQQDGIVPAGAAAELLAEGVEGDDFAIDAASKYAYVAGTLTTNVVYRVDLEKGYVEILSGKFNSTDSPLIVPTAVQFGRTQKDWRSIYVTTDGGHGKVRAPNSQGLTRFDVEDCAKPYIF